MEQPLKIVIADGHEIFRDGFNLIFRNIDEVKQIAEASNGKDLIEIVRKSQPDVVITDIHMPVMNGIEATGYITANFSSVKVIGLAMFNEISDVVEMLAAGAHGYLLKNVIKGRVVKPIFLEPKAGNIFVKAQRLK